MVIKSSPRVGFINSNNFKAIQVTLNTVKPLRVLNIGFQHLCSLYSLCRMRIIQAILFAILQPHQNFRIPEWQIVTASKVELILLPGY